jgi:hypothetical protein
MKYSRNSMVILGLAAALFVTSTAPATAEPLNVELLIDLKNGAPGLPNEYTKLNFADGSNRYVALVRRSGKVVGNGPFAGATVQDWGLHEVSTKPEITGQGTGYLVISHGDADVVYLKTQTRSMAFPKKGDRQDSIFIGTWEVTGASGKFRGLEGAGTLRVNPLSPSERQWLLTGEVNQLPAAHR